MTIYIAQREGTGGPIADAAATYTSTSTGRTAAALVDGMGHDADIVRLAPMLAETAARVGAVRGALAGLLSAGLVVTDPGPDAVGVLAVTREDGRAELVWAGDCRAYRWDGTALEVLTTDHTLAAYLSRAAKDAGDVPVTALADFVGVTLGLAVAGDRALRLGASRRGADPHHRRCPRPGVSRRDRGPRAQTRQRSAGPGQRARRCRCAERRGLPRRCDGRSDQLTFKSPVGPTSWDSTDVVSQEVGPIS